jgi:hypothetical protein
MVANMSVGHDENVNILYALQLFTAAWKNLSITAVSNCRGEAGILSMRDEIMEENLIDDDDKYNWQQIRQKRNVLAEVMMEDFIIVDSDVAIIQETTDDDDFVNTIIEEKG